jgi:hypothetical protein
MSVMMAAFTDRLLHNAAVIADLTINFLIVMLLSKRVNCTASCGGFR